ncbi:hypothetical protein cce_0486 [Crocosphaera subtropica ATCC 51142]|uniref:Uncharacterized protein n=1 Tax=Crocosphaera subtropica (strain ATCC 51142 / BH68) TaxID=43989 RepID=B1WNJ5_CROS5|nr:hypothetical protein [Crocosphaera subtropica]ACB49837.1 hypothetical protein cce_0486 [Crocosphaera subtropica ATCC 51142]
MSTLELVNIAYPEFNVTETNPESYYLLRLMNLYGADFNEEEILNF